MGFFFCKMSDLFHSLVLHKMRGSFNYMGRENKLSERKKHRVEERNIPFQR